MKDLSKRMLGRGNCKCKGFGVRRNLVFLKESYVVDDSEKENDSRVKII